MNSNITPPAGDAAENINPEENNTGSIAENTSAEVSAEQLDEIKQRLKMEQNLGMGIVASLAASLVCAIIWAAITVATKYQIAYMAIGVGFLVGFANRVAGKGIDIIFGGIGAVFALLGCLVGNYLTVVAFASSELGMDFFKALGSLSFSMVFDILAESFGVYDALFYGIALYLGYKVSFRQVTEDDLKKLI